MIRLLIIFSFFILTSYADSSSYKLCRYKLLDSKTISNSSLQISVYKHKRIIYSPSPPNTKILKRNDFLGLYLVNDKYKFAYPFRIRDKKYKDVASINKRSIIKGKIVKKQIGLNTLATFNKAVSYPSIISSELCYLEGLVTPTGIIEKEYLKHFLLSNKYADIGIRVKKKSSNIKVISIDPFLKLNPFKKDDNILKLNGKKVENLALFMQEILFSKIGTVQKVVLKRQNRVIEIDIKSYQRYGGGFISDTFLEQKGIYFNKALEITKLDILLADYGLRLGDKLIQINNIKVENQAEVRVLISEFKDLALLLFERDNFQFFVKIN